MCVTGNHNLAKPQTVHVVKVIWLYRNNRLISTQYLINTLATASFQWTSLTQTRTRTHTLSLSLSIITAIFLSNITELITILSIHHNTTYERQISMSTFRVSRINFQEGLGGLFPDTRTSRRWGWAWGDYIRITMWMFYLASMLVTHLRSVTQGRLAWVKCYKGGGRFPTPWSGNEMRW